jgi:hypothetical protein
LRFALDRSIGDDAVVAQIVVVRVASVTAGSVAPDGGPFGAGAAPTALMPAAAHTSTLQTARMRLVTDPSEPSESRR